MLKPDLDGRISDPKFDITTKLISNNSLGKESGKGFYLYDSKNRKIIYQFLKD